MPSLPFHWHHVRLRSRSLLERLERINRRKRSHISSSLAGHTQLLPCETLKIRFPTTGRIIDVGCTGSFFRGTFYWFRLQFYLQVRFTISNQIL
jgi:hypothetical protein